MKKKTRSPSSEFMGERKRNEGAVYRVMERHRRALMRKEAKTVARILRLWNVAGKRISEKLRAVETAIQTAKDAGLPISPDWLYQQQRWTHFEIEIENQIARLQPSLLTLTRQAGIQAVSLATGHVSELARAIGIDRQFRTMAPGVLETVAGALSEGSPVAQLFREMGPGALKAARDVFASGVVAGENPRKIGRRLREQIEELGPQRSVTIARQESLRAYRDVHQRSYERNSDLLLGSRVVCARDGRTCWLCLAQDGKIIPHGEKFASHVACRCGLAPVLIKDDKPRETGEQWLMKQPIDIQKRYLGPGRFELWKKGQVSLHDMIEFPVHPKWGRQVRPMRLDDVRAMLATGRRKLAPLTRVENGMAVSGPRASAFVDAASSTLNVRVRGSVNRPIADGIAAIDSVHGPGTLAGKTLPVFRESKNEFHEAAFYRSKWNLEGERIGVKQEGNASPGFSLVHEFGHYLDNDDMNGEAGYTMERVVLESGNPNRMRLTAEQEAARTAFWNAVDQTEALAQIKDMWPFSPEHVEYLLRDREIWARAYSQYVVVKSGHPRLLSELNGELERIRLGDYPFQSQWTESDFAPIIGKIEDVLRVFGLIL